MSLKLSGRAALLGCALVPVLMLGMGGCSDDTVELEPDPDPDPELAYAHAAGIRLTRLTLNQGVQVELVSGNDVAGAGDYPVPLIAGRAMLVRAHYFVHAEFEPRELLAQLRVSYPEDDGREELLLDSVVTVAGDSLERSLHHTFAWYLEADQVVSGLRLRADVYEPAPYPPDAVPDPDPDAAGAQRIDAPALPWARQDAELTADSDPMRIHVTLVPIEHHFDDCVSEASVPADEVAAMRNELEQNNPVQTVEVTVRDPVIWDETIGESESGFSPILSMLSMLHEDDDAGPYEYYYGLITTCDGYPSGLLGQAFGIPQEIDPGLGYMRVSAGRYAGNGQAASETFVHEVGHTQGRRHVRCSGEAGVDPNYPHSGGITGVWGFGIHDLRLRSPAGSRDYMTYCANEWVSDYGYNLVWPVIEALTQWQLEAEMLAQAGQVGSGLRADELARDEILVGALYPDGTLEWWTTRGSLAGQLDPQLSLSWELDGEDLRLPVWVSERGDDETLNLTSALPEGGLDGARFTLELDGPDVRGIALAQPDDAPSFDALHRAGH